MGLFGPDFDNEARREIKRVRKRLFGEFGDSCLNIINSDVCDEQAGVIGRLWRRVDRLEAELFVLKSKKRKGGKK